MKKDNIDTFFNPKSVAIVGATKKLDKAGHVIFKNFANNKKRGIFQGEIYPINPRESNILGFKCYSRITEIPGELELVVIVVPAKIVPQIMEDAAVKKVKTAIIITAGFREIGEKDLEKQIVSIAQKAGIHILGPNCLGVYYSKTGVDTLFLPETKVLTNGDEIIATPRPMFGKIAIVTQSGAFGVAALDYLAGRQMGISKFVSFGNKSDITETDVLHYLLSDNETRAILLYVEDIKHGRHFLKIAKAVSLKKPIIALKSGKSTAGARAAASHTGAIAGSNKIYDTIFSSYLLRAKETAKFFQNKNNKIISDKRLNEINYGKFEGITYKKAKKIFPKITNKLDAGKSVAFPNGEDYKSVIKRLKSFIRYIVKKNIKKTLVVTHNVVLRVLIGLYYKIDQKYWHLIKIKHLKKIDFFIYNRKLIPNIDRKFLKNVIKVQTLNKIK